MCDNPHIREPYRPEVDDPLASTRGVDPRLFNPRGGEQRMPQVYSAPTLDTVEEEEPIRRLAGHEDIGPEPGMMTQEQPYFTGDVASAINDMWLACNRAPEGTRLDEMEAALLWSTLTAPANPPASILNRRVDTSFIATVEGDIPDDRVKDKTDSKLLKHRHQERDHDQKTSRTIVSTERKTSRTYSLSARAATFGSKIMGDYRRVIGVMESGGRNRKWAVAVARWIITHKGFGAAKNKWITMLTNDKQLPPGKAKVTADRLQQTLNLWAFQKDELIEFEPDQDTKRVPSTETTVIDTPPHSDMDLGASFVEYYIYE